MCSKIYVLYNVETFCKEVPIIDNTIIYAGNAKNK